MNKPFYVTTAIDYTNGSPHIGHAYEKILADTITRYQRLSGREAYFLTGVDQHGQKVQQSAEKQGRDPAEYADTIAGEFIALWDKLNVRYDGWAATTDPRHKACVQKALQHLHDAGQLYKKAHRGFYSVRQEQFLTDKERQPDGNFGPEWGEVVELEEENWYFKLSEHVAWLRNFVASNESCVIPAFRRQELLNALDKAEGADLCISRPRTRLQWGIPLPFDPEFVNYVWFDALMNYISFAGYLADENTNLPRFEDLWPADAQIIGKDILVPPHGVYWLIMLHALGIPDDKMPVLLVHGWWNIRSSSGQSEKMSKSLGNVIDPAALTATFGPDAVRYYLMRDIATGQDADFIPDRLASRYQTDLGNDLGNLANRTLNMIGRYRSASVPEAGPENEDDTALRQTAATTLEAYRSAMDNFLPHLALEAVWKWVAQCNQYAERRAPWTLAKDPAKGAELDTVLHHLAESLAHIALLVSPVIPGSASGLMDQLQLTPAQRATTLTNLQWGILPPGHTTGKPSPLFPRIDLDAQQQPE